MEITRIESQPVVGIRRSTTADGIKETLGEIMSSVWSYAMSHGGIPAGPPITRYFSWSEDAVELEALVPLVAPIAGEGEVVAGELPGGEVARAVHEGSYESLGDTHMALGQWLKEQGVTPSGPCWEVYLTDPGEVADPADYRTEIVYPV
jgi:effector-binding domain-containing protein